MKVRKPSVAEEDPIWSRSRADSHFKSNKETPEESKKFFFKLFIYWFFWCEMKGTPLEEARGDLCG